MVGDKAVTVSPIVWEHRMTDKQHPVPDSQETVPRGGRRRRGARGGQKAPFLSGQLEWGAATFLDVPTEPISEDAVEAIHNASMTVLEDIGILFMNDEALAILSDAGCDVDMDSQRVRMDRDFVMQAVARAPSQFTITPRNPDRQISFGGTTFQFWTGRICTKRDGYGCRSPYRYTRRFPELFTPVAIFQLHPFQQWLSG
jgi:trimethylamine:corrinoid methyltransferase-like protein